MGLDRKYFRLILISFTLLFILLLVYAPHFSYKYPYHIDEWRHISESLKLSKGELPQGYLILEIGFNIFLLAIIKLGFDVVLIYKYLPALFAVISSLVLFFFIYKKMGRLYIALFSMLFFASLRSNVNLTGLWFFTPLTFAIPLIYLFFWLFSEGVEKNNLKSVYWSLFVYSIVFISHPISATFMLPILLVYLTIHRKFVKKHYKPLLIILAVPALMFIVLFEFFWQKTFIKTLKFLSTFIFFKYGWGVLEIRYNIITFYGILAFILAIFGVYFAYRKRQYLLMAWPLTLLFFILLFHLFSFTIFAPYQRLLYYTMLGLVPLSAIGLYYLLMLLKDLLKKWLKYIWAVNLIISVILIFVFAVVFQGYYKLGGQVALYQLVDDNSYEAIKFLENYPKTVVLAPVFTSTAIYPISGHDIVATLYFYGLNKRKLVEEAYLSGNCTNVSELAKKNNATFILNDVSMGNCGWNEIYNDGYYIYSLK
ncbi:MAG: glycosyltransferase family 39 protein [Nanoarchaeota archaeon]|nr:glycosyltransferase family 39 protein [Nanoarchaeota archaeon]MBU1005762.1 glycosyltransferase family 39 protein [Nanoarchaeota archaeon]MBU1946633.1 glycosyltransferase family 39 protein [Nanoarchaeota archaeon]